MFIEGFLVDIIKPLNHTYKASKKLYALNSFYRTYVQKLTDTNL